MRRTPTIDPKATCSPNRLWVTHGPSINTMFALLPKAEIGLPEYVTPAAELVVSVAKSAGIGRIAESTFDAVVCNCTGPSGNLGTFVWAIASHGMRFFSNGTGSLQQQRSLWLLLECLPCSSRSLRSSLKRLTSLLMARTGFGPVESILPIQSQRETLCFE